MTNLRNLRDALGWSREELARRAGVSAKTIEAHEIGSPEDVYKSISVKLATALGCDETHLFFLEDYASTHNLADPETLSSLETAKQERVVIQEMALEDAALEMRPTSTPAALQRLEQQVQTYGRKNHLGHKQLGDIILVGGVLLELAWDVTSNDEPEAVTESRAEEILNALFEQSNPQTAALTQALATPERTVQ